MDMFKNVITRVEKVLTSERYISAKAAEFVIWILKYLILRSEWGNIKEWNKYPRAILNMRQRRGQKQKWNLFLFCSNSQYDRS